jgi:hypothetical protein
MRAMHPQRLATHSLCASLCALLLALLAAPGCTEDSDSNEDLGASDADLGASDADLGASDADLGASDADLGASDTDLGASDTDLGASDPGPAPTGVRAYFELGASFYDFPWPSDLRFDPDGTISAEQLPDGPGQALYLNLRAIAGELRGFSQVPVIWIRFDGAVAPPDPDTVIAPSVTLGAFLINVEAESDGYLELVPITARALDEDAYTDAGVLALAPLRGAILRPATRYALVVRRAWGDAEGADLGVPEPLWQLAHGRLPASGWTEQSAATFRPLWEALDALGVPRDEVAAATVFTTGNVVADLADLSERVRAAHDAELGALAVDAADGAAHERFCELHGELTVPQFQAGRPPFDTEGLFEMGDDGLPVHQRDEAIPVVVNLPTGAMPAAGYPLALYFHGSGGVSEQVVDRGPINRDGSDGPPGFGPAHVLAAHGIASVGSAHPVNPERLPGASSLAYLNFNNLASFRDIFRQGVLEQRLFLDALLALRIDPDDVADCEGLALPEGVESYRFDPASVVAMGQSMGGMYTNLVGPVEPRIRAVAPTGAGGHWSAFILETQLIPNASALIATIFRARGELSYMHPLLHTLQMAWEPVEPLVFVPRLAREPLPEHPARPIYEPVGLGDSYFPPTTFDAFALAYGNEMAGDEVWTSMREVLASDGRGEILEYPVLNNRTSANGQAYTGVVVQYEGDGFSDPHTIFSQFDEVKRQYGCFFESFLASGVAVVPAPTGLGGPCPTPEPR